MKVVTANHGDVWGRGGASKWYTFYCGKCGKQIWAGDKNCKNCNEPVEYKKERVGMSEDKNAAQERARADFQDNLWK